MDLSHPPLEQYAHGMERISLEEKRRVLPEGRARVLSGYDDRWYFRKCWHEEAAPVTHQVETET